MAYKPVLCPHGVLGIGKCEDCKWARKYRARGHKPVRIQRAEVQRLKDKEYRDSGAYTEWRFGLPRGEYAKMLEAQGGGCAICGRTQEDNVRGRRLAVDHDHTCCPGQRSCGRCVRGLLCHHCNVMLAGARDDHSHLVAGAAYLTKWAQRPRREVA